MSEAAEQARPNRIPTPAELGFDPAELRQKYAQERVKRLRPDGNNQYQEIAGKFAHFNDDPYVAPSRREAIKAMSAERSAQGACTRVMPRSRSRPASAKALSIRCRSTSRRLRST